MRAWDGRSERRPRGPSAGHVDDADLDEVRAAGIDLDPRTPGERLRPGSGGEGSPASEAGAATDGQASTDGAHTADGAHAPGTAHDHAHPHSHSTPGEPPLIGIV